MTLILDPNDPLIKAWKEGIVIPSPEDEIKKLTDAQLSCLARRKEQYELYKIERARRDKNRRARAEYVRQKNHDNYVKRVKSLTDVHKVDHTITTEKIIWFVCHGYSYGQLAAATGLSHRAIARRHRGVTRYRTPNHLVNKEANNGTKPN